MTEAFDQFEQRLASLRPRRPSAETRARVAGALGDACNVNSSVEVAKTPARPDGAAGFRLSAAGEPGAIIGGRGAVGGRPVWLGPVALAAAAALAVGIGWLATRESQYGGPASSPHAKTEKKNHAAPAPAKGRPGWERAGYFSNPALPDHARSDAGAILPEIAFEEVAVADAEPDEVLGGLSGGFAGGKVRNKGGEALPSVDLIVVRYVRGSNGSWEPQRARTAVLPVLPAGATVEFRVRTKWKKAEMGNFVLFARESPGVRGGWGNLAVADEKEIKLEAQGAPVAGKDRIILSGWVQNNLPRTAVEYRVQVDLYDTRNQFVDTVQHIGTYTGEGEPLAPGRKRTWEIAVTQFRLAELGSARARAIARVE
jgi:hypothetical protein